jgi:hypothetical protein
MTTTKEKETSLAIKDSSYLLFRSSANETTEAIKVNLGEGGMEPTGLPKISIPAGGGQSFDVPTLEGTEPQKTVEGVIVNFNDFRTYWEEGFDGSGTPPDCYSIDSRSGVGTPGGECSSCPLSQWGSSADGKGQACNLKRKLMIVPEDRNLPIVLDVPPSSLKPIKDYFLNLASFGKKFYHIISRFSLEVDKSKGGIKFSKLKIEMARPLDETEKDMIDKYVSSIEASMTKDN